MACTPTPTQTLYEVLTTTTESTTFTEIVSTIPPDLTTLLTTVCLSSTIDPDGNTTCLASSTREVISTIQDEEVTTIPSQVVFEVTVTESEPTSTLFSLCPTDNPSGISSPPIITSSGSVVLSASQASSTFPNGSVAVSWVTYTSTLPPTWVTAPPPTNGPDGNGSSNAPDDLGPIIGGALGGFVGFTVLAVLAWFIWRKRDMFHNTYPKDHVPNFEPSVYPSWSRRDKTNSLQPGPEPKPYQYGLVGRKAGTPSRESSPTPSPAPTRPQSLAFTGLSPTPYSAGFPLGPPTPNSGLGHSPYSATFPQQSPPPNTNGAPTPSPYSATFPQQPSPSNANTLYAPPSPFAPAFAPAPPAAPASPPPQPPPQPPAPTQQQAPPWQSTTSVASVGTAVSYPYPVLSPHAEEDVSSVSDRRPMRLSLTLANWNPETDGELFPRRSEDDGDKGSETQSVRQRRAPP